MNQTEIADLLNDQVLAAAAAIYGLDKNGLKQLASGNVNAVFEYNAEGSESYVLRLTHRTRRELREIMAEAEFVHFLKGQGASVCGVILSINGRVAEEVAGEFTAVLFEKATGHLPVYEEWNHEFFYNWGKMTGQFHRLTQSYQPNPEFKRHQWYEDALFQVEKWIPAEQTEVHRQARELFDRLNRLPMTADGYGLVHGDLHAGNFFVEEEGTLTAFDFDDCCYAWYPFDIAFLMYPVLTKLSRPPGHVEGEADVVRTFLTHFMAGYRTENELDNSWWQTMPDFLKLRRLQLYVFYHQWLDFSNLTEERARVIEQTRKDIEADFAPTGFDFAEVAV